jgi:hypothetical protein
MLGKLNRYLTKFSILLMTAALIAGMVGCDGDSYTPSQNLEIRTWYDLDDVRDNLDGDHILMNDLDSTTPGYTELASEMAHGGKGWKPINLYYHGVLIGFVGTFDGQGYEIRDLFINRPGEDYAGLFGFVDYAGVIQDIGVVNATVIGAEYVGGLVGYSHGTVSNSSSTGSVTGNEWVGGLVGQNHNGAVSNSYSSSSVTGDEYIGGLVGWNVLPSSTFPIRGTVSNSSSTGSVTGNRWVGGLAGQNTGTVSNSHSCSSVTGYEYVGGLVGLGDVSDSYFTGSVSGTTRVGGLVGVGLGSNSYYNYDEVLINGENIITRGALFGEDFEEWLANGKFLDFNDRLSQENGYYVVNNVTDFKQLLAFGQNATLKFRLKSDLDLGDEPNFYIPYLAGEFDGNGHKISNLSFNFDFVCSVGLFGYLAFGGNVTDLAAENVNITGDENVGGLVGYSRGTVGNSSSTGSVTGEEFVGGLVGWNEGTVSNSHFMGTVTGDCVVGGLVGANGGTVSNSYSSGNVSGINGAVGGLVGANGGTVSNSYSTASVTSDNNVGGLVGENGGTVSNSSSSGNVTSDHNVGGLVGANYDTVSNSYSTGSVTGNLNVGGLVGVNGYGGTLSNSYSTGSVIGDNNVGGLVGQSWDAVSNSYSTGSVTGDSHVGGLVGVNSGLGTVSNSYSTGNVIGDEYVGGLVGSNEDGGIVSKSFWDTETSGQATSAGGTGKTTEQMQDITIFSGTGWNITEVALNETNPAYIWNIVNNVTYPFLSWQTV